MLRADVNQRLLNMFERPAYLEIGVDFGVTFHAVEAALKVAVDPALKFDVEAAKADPANAHCQYHAVESDIYFDKIKPTDQKFDVVFIDGLHTFDQTLKDLLNAIGSVRDNGVIVVDDVIPPTYAASIPDLGRALAMRQIIPADASWMGDVYKLVFFVHHYLPFFDYATVQENHGQMILWRGKRGAFGQYATKVEDIARLEFIDSVLDRSVFNLQPAEEIFARIPPR